MKRENAELEFRIQQASEGHKLNVELLTGQIEEVEHRHNHDDKTSSTIDIMTFALTICHRDNNMFR